MFAVSAPSSEQKRKNKIENHCQNHVVNAKHQSAVVANVGL